MPIDGLALVVAELCYCCRYLRYLRWLKFCYYYPSDYCDKQYYYPATALLSRYLSRRLIPNPHSLKYEHMRHLLLFILLSLACLALPPPITPPPSETTLHNHLHFDFTWDSNWAHIILIIIKLQSAITREQVICYIHRQHIYTTCRHFLGCRLHKRMDGHN